MNQPAPSSAARVQTALRLEVPDRVPFLLMVTLHGARELGLPPRDYFARAEHVVEGQLRMHTRYRHDCLTAFFHAALEFEAWGGEVLFRDDGPPNAGAPLVRHPDGILDLRSPRVQEAPGLRRVLEATARLRERAQGVPILGVVLSPFSLPVMQLGFDRYLEVLHERPALVTHLMRVNEDFCVEWGNAQFTAGADALCYFDPCVSPTVTTAPLARTGFEVARRTLARLRGPVVTHLASGRSLGVVDALAATGTLGVGVGTSEDLRAVKVACAGRLAVIGNLDGISMRRWDAAQATQAVRAALDAAAPGGGFLLSDSHGEIPLQVPEAVLDEVSEAVRRWGGYPLERDVEAAST